MYNVAFPDLQVGDASEAMLARSRCLFFHFDFLVVFIVTIRLQCLIMQSILS